MEEWIVLGWGLSLCASIAPNRRPSLCGPGTSNLGLPRYRNRHILIPAGSKRAHIDTGGIVVGISTETRASSPVSYTSSVRTGHPGRDGEGLSLRFCTSTGSWFNSNQQRTIPTAQKNNQINTTTVKWNVRLGMHAFYSPLVLFAPSSP